ncbi:MAG: hypothetical protein HKM28_02660 [Flavobacteriaceae bacterium]|nr:hypothetical protein [Flavobacteriaceae bacterium]
MKTKEFFQLLNQYKDTSLLFEYAPNQLVGTNYHITEVKHVSIDSVDCGSQTDAWNETIIQLWESPADLGAEDYMSTFKALGILNKVGKMKAYDTESEVKFEYSNALFHTSQLHVNDYSLRGKNLIVHLGVRATDCKAKEACGVPETASVNEVETASCCSPESGCC